MNVKVYLLIIIYLIIIIMNVIMIVHVYNLFSVFIFKIKKMSLKVLPRGKLQCKINGHYLVMLKL